MNYPQLYFYPYSIQKEFPYQVGNLCTIHLGSNFESISDKYKKIYLKMKELITKSYDSYDFIDTDTDTDTVVDTENITIDFENVISKKYIEKKMEILKELFDWLNKQWMFSMKKIDSMIISYGRYPVIKIVYHYEESERTDFENAYIDLYDFEKKILNDQMLKLTYVQGKNMKFTKTFLEKDSYNYEYISKIDTNKLNIENKFLTNTKNTELFNFVNKHYLVPFRNNFGIWTNHLFQSFYKIPLSLAYTTEKYLLTESENEKTSNVIGCLLAISLGGVIFYRLAFSENKYLDIVGLRKYIEIIYKSKTENS